MVNLWHKYKYASKRKKQTLHSLIAGLVFFCTLYFISAVFKFPLCPIKRFFGISCPGCGLTRGFIAILHFDFSAATQYNLLSIPLFIGILVYGVLCIVDIIFDFNNIERLERMLGRTFSKVCLILLYVLYFFLFYLRQR